MGFGDGNDISCTIYKQSAPRPRLTTIPTPHHSFLQAECSSWCPTNSVKALAPPQMQPHYATRPLQLWRQWGPTILGPLQLLRLTIIIRWAMWEEDQTLLRRKWNRSMKGNGWNMGGAVTGDAEGMGEVKEGDRHPPHVRTPPTFQPWLNLWAPCFPKWK